MNYKNAVIFCDDFQFHRGGFSVEDGRFTAVPDERADAVDLGGAYVIPGLIDIHNHGNSGVDFSDGDYDSDLLMARYLARNGVTSFAPATLTLPYDVLERAFAAGARLHRDAPEGAARLLGAQMEGPFFSAKKKGAQNADYLRLPDFAAFKHLYDACGGLIRIVDIAPELPGAVDFIAQAKALCTVSIAHTDADYEQARAAVEAGVTHLTHTFNAMPPIHHRNPGVIGACSEAEGVRAELICDGLHVHPSSVRMAFKLFGAERMCLVSDALRCCGMPDGEYLLGGQKTFLSGSVARLADGTIAGSATNLYRCMRNAVSFGIPAGDAIRAASYNPACAIGMEALVGSIGVGKYADFVVCDETLALREVYIGGKKVI